MTAIRELQLSIGYPILWLLLMILERHYKSFSEYMSEQGFEYVGYGMYVSSE